MGTNAGSKFYFWNMIPTYTIYGRYALIEHMAQVCDKMQIQIYIHINLRLQRDWTCIWTQQVIIEQILYQWSMMHGYVLLYWWVQIRRTLLNKDEILSFISTKQ